LYGGKLPGASSYDCVTLAGRPYKLWLAVTVILSVSGHFGWSWGGFIGFLNPWIRFWAYLIFPITPWIDTSMWLKIGPNPPLSKYSRWEKWYRWVRLCIFACWIGIFNLFYHRMSLWNDIHNNILYWNIGSNKCLIEREKQILNHREFGEIT
jgi:hypothetical protein